MLCWNLNFPLLPNARRMYSNSTAGEISNLRALSCFVDIIYNNVESDEHICVLGLLPAVMTIVVANYDSNQSAKNWC